MEGFDDDFSPLQSVTTKQASNGNPSDSQNESMEGSKEAKGDQGVTGATSPANAGRFSEPREDPEVIKQWKEEQAEKLKLKDEEEEEAKVSLRAQATKELEEWYKQHSEQLIKLQNTNRAASESAEREFKSTIQEIKPGTEWERVAKLCDFNPKNTRNTKDISRLRSVILQLKQGGSCTRVSRST